MKRKTIVNSIIIIILILLFGYFIKYGYDNHKENFTEKLYKCKVIYKHQAMSSGKYPSERLYFVLFIEEENKNYETYFNIETWYKYNVGGTMFIKLQKESICESSKAVLIEMLFVTCVAFIIIFILVFISLLLYYIYKKLIGER